MKYIVPTDMTLFEALSSMAKESSKNSLRGWLRAERIFVNGLVEKNERRQLRPKDEVSLGKKLLYLSEGLRILFEDRDLVVIDKPPGLLSVATDFEKSITAHAILKERFRSQMVYPVHRLDRETSGVMLFAYSERAKDVLKETFASHAIERIYYAVVEGVPPEKKGVWKSLLIEDSAYVVRSSKEGRIAVTHYEVISSRAGCSLLQLRLETGRKNQIRVHCSEAGFPIVGDEKYGAKTNPFKRLALHAHILGFLHPISQKAMRFQSPFPSCFHKYAEKS